MDMHMYMHMHRYMHMYMHMYMYMCMCMYDLWCMHFNYQSAYILEHKTHNPPRGGGTYTS